jgi:DNA-binding beta-propeller fold protein YncE
MNSIGLYFIQFVAIAAVFYKMKSSILDPTEWTEPNLVPQREGVLAVNDYLSETKVRQIVGNFGGPESVAFDPDSGFAYNSLSDGTVIKFDAKGEVVQRNFFFVGAWVKGMNQDQSNELYEWCRKEADEGRVSWDKNSEKKCGRPLGLRFRKVSSISTRLIV